MSAALAAFVCATLAAAPSLSSLNVTGLTGLTPAFSPNVTAYALKAAPETGSLPLTATLAEAGYLEINGNGAPSGQTVNASTWNDKITVKAISANWAETRTYTITIQRVTPPRLESLNVAGLTPAFSPSTTQYSITVPTSTGNIPLTAVLAAPKGFLSVNSNMTTDGAPVNASTWGDRIRVAAISPNWQLTNTYTITVIRSNSAPAPTPTPPPSTPPPAPTPTYALTVNNGSGSGSYTAGTSVTITAAAAPAGQQFSGWTGTTVANASAASTTLTMPAAAASVTATFTPIVTDFTLSVISGTGSGTYTAGANVAIAAGAPPAGQEFSHWATTHGAMVSNATNASATLTMPAANATVTAVFQAPLPAGAVAPAAPAHPILFVTQIPIGYDFTTIGSTFGNHRPATNAVARGGDLFIRYPSGALRNLTAAAGYGVASGFQGANSIAVRDPAVHWSGQKAVFSMVIGAPTTAFGAANGTWQLYEITGLGETDTPVITKVANQPAYNNVSPLYGTDSRILFTSDRPRNGQSHLYPQLDEYELTPTVTGIWSLNPATGDLFNLNHTPSGAFTPSLDSFGRVIFTRWDHLQQDQEADIDRSDIAQGRQPSYGVFNYTNESATAQVLYGDRTEVFPELRNPTPGVAGHTFNHFFPWMIHEDGTEEETLNHIGRQELVGYASRSFTNDPNIVDFSIGNRLNQTMAENYFHLREDPTQPGRYFAIDAPEFTTHSAGLIISLYAPPSQPAHQIPLTYVSYPVGRFGFPAPATNPGKFREPLPLANGTLVAVHTAATEAETKSAVGVSDYAFRLKTMVGVGGYQRAHQPLTSGLWKNASFYVNGALVSYNGPLWELNPVEVRARAIPIAAKPPLGQPEQDVFAEEGVDVATFKADLAAKGLALVVSRNVTTRDRADKQQPYNLRIAGTATQTVANNGLLYDIAHLQFFQADQIRGLGMRTAASTPSPGRRVLAQPLHDANAVALNPANPAGPAGSVQLGADGSMAAVLPARRATTWQLTDPAGVPSVRERYWVTFQPGEIRSCTSCHGVNNTDQANHFGPTNKPEALRALLQKWKTQTGN